jgi:hypothetical protein
MWIEARSPQSISPHGAHCQRPELDLVESRPQALRSLADKSFTAVDNCACSFEGQSGTVTIRPSGTVSPNGSESGTFLIGSGGASSGGLATLAGYGTFSRWGQPAGTLSLVEHLRIT